MAKISQGRKALGAERALAERLAAVEASLEQCQRRLTALERAQTPATPRPKPPSGKGTTAVS